MTSSLELIYQPEYPDTLMKLTFTADGFPDNYSSFSACNKATKGETSGPTALHLLLLNASNGTIANFSSNSFPFY
jgi:hypothetical protein